LSVDRFVTKIIALKSQCQMQLPNVSHLPWGKKLHRFIFAIALSELHLLGQFLAHIYSNKFSIILIFHILYIIRGGEPF